MLFKQAQLLCPSRPPVVVTNGYHDRRHGLLPDLAKGSDTQDQKTQSQRTADEPRKDGPRGERQIARTIYLFIFRAEPPRSKSDPQPTRTCIIHTGGPVQTKPGSAMAWRRVRVLAVVSSLATVVAFRAEISSSSHHYNRIRTSAAVSTSAVLRLSAPAADVMATDDGDRTRYACMHAPGLHWLTAQHCRSRPLGVFIALCLSCATGSSP